MRRKIYFLLFFFLCLTSIPLAAQDIEIKGMVTEATTNEPLPGVTVRVKDKDTGPANLEGHSSSSKEFVEAVLQLYDRIVNQELLVRRVTIAACHVIAQDAVKREPKQLD